MATVDISSAAPKFGTFIVLLLLLNPLPSERASSLPEEAEGHLLIDVDAVLVVDAADPLRPPPPSVLTGAKMIAGPGQRAALKRSRTSRDSLKVTAG